MNTLALTQNILSLLSAAWRQRYLIVIPILLIPVLATMIGTYSKQRWMTYTTILVQESAKMNPFLEDLSVSTNLEKRIKSLDTLLRSRHMLIEVGIDLGYIKETDSTSLKEQFVKRTANALNVNLIGDDLVKISYTSDSRDEIDVILNAISERFLERLLAPELATLKASESFLKDQIDERRENLRRAELRLAQFKDDNAQALPNLYGDNTKRLSELRELREEYAIKLSGAEAAKTAIRTRLAQVDPVMSGLEDAIAKLKSELAIYRSRYTETHSKVQTTLSKLKRLEEERAEQSKLSLKLDEKGLQRLWEIATKGGLNDDENNELLISQLKELQSAESRVQQLAQELASIDAQLKRIQTSVESYGHIERQLFDLERDLKVKRMLYDELLERYEKASVTGALGRFEQPERIKVIDKPFVPSKPVNLPVILYFIIGIIAGIVLGVGMAVVAEFTDTSLRRREQLENLTGLPVLTRIPNLSRV